MCALRLHARVRNVCGLQLTLHSSNNKRAALSCWPHQEAAQQPGAPQRQLAQPCQAPPQQHILGRRVSDVERVTKLDRTTEAAGGSSGSSGGSRSRSGAC